MIIYYIIIPILIFLVLIYLARKDVLLTVLFIYTLHVFLKFLLFKIIPTAAFASGTFINISLVLFFLFYSLSNPRIIYNKYFIYFSIYIFSFFIYLIFISILNGYNFYNYIYHVRNYFFTFLLFIIFLNSNNKRYNPFIFINFIILILSIQSTIAILQYQFPIVAQFFTIKEYVRFGVEIESFTSSFEGQNLVTGTLDQMQDISSFIMLNLIFILCFFIFLKNKIDHKITLVIFISFIAMILTGVRAPLIGLLFGIGIIIWFNNKKAFLLSFITFTIITLLIVQTYDNLIQYALSGIGSGNIEDPFTRVLGAFALFNPDYHELTSVGRTYILFEFILQNPLFGSAPGIIFSDYSFSDAFLTLWTVETGLIGLTYLLLPYIYLLSLVKEKLSLPYSRISFILFLVALSQSFTNEGLWTFYTNTQFFFYIMLLYRLKSENNYLIKQFNP